MDHIFEPFSPPPEVGTSWGFHEITDHTKQGTIDCEPSQFDS
jgi:hypothetical protein